MCNTKKVWPVELANHLLSFVSGYHVEKSIGLWMKYGTELHTYWKECNIVSIKTFDYGYFKLYLLLK